MKDKEELIKMVNPSITDSSILYYPSIEFLDDGFIKSSLCIWDTIYRIVPESYTPEDSEEISMAVQQGAIKNIRLSKRDLSCAYEGFLDFITSIPFLPAGLDGLDGCHTIDLHKDKVDMRLYPYLKELAKKVSGDWITLSEQVVHGYMLFLANSICENRNIPKITDNPDVFSLMTYFENKAQFDEFVSSPNADEYYSSLIVPTLIPAGVERVDMGTILKFREKTIKERAEFKNTITFLADELNSIKDREYAQEVTTKFVYRLENSKQSLFESGNTFFRNFVSSYLSIGIPTAISTLGLFGNTNPFTTKQAFESCFVGAIAAFADGVSKRNSWRSETASYYWGLKNIFDDGVGRIVSPRFDRAFDEFIND